MLVVDSHVHFWDLSAHHYPWLANPGTSFVGDARDLKHDYLPTDLIEDAADIEVLKVVHVEANYDPAHPVGETRWLQSLADTRRDRAQFAHDLRANAAVAEVVEGGGNFLAVALRVPFPSGRDVVTELAERHRIIVKDISARVNDGRVWVPGPDGSPDREVWRLVYVEDRPVAEAAQVLGVPVGTVKSRAHRVRRLLRAALRPEGGAS